jgi:hypothetical protein
VTAFLPRLSSKVASCLGEAGISIFPEEKALVGEGIADMKRINLGVLAVMIAASAYAQAPDFLELAKSGTVKDVQSAIKSGAKVNAKDQDGGTALMSAARYNQNPDVIATLLKAGARLNDLDKFNMSPLMYAAEDNPNPRVVVVLLKAGANAKIRDNTMGQTAFEWGQGNKSLKGTDALRLLKKASQ